MLLAGAIIVVVRIAVFMRRRDDFFTVDAYAMVEVVFTLAMVFLLASKPEVLVWAWKRLSSTSGMPFLLFYLISIASALWSQMFAYSAFRSLEFASQTFALFIVMFLARGNAERENTLIKLCVAVLLLEVFGSLISGLGFRSNSYSASAAMLFSYGFGELLGAEGKRRIRMIVISSVGFVFVVLGLSLASLWSLLFGVFLAVLVSSRHRALMLLAGPLILALLFCLPGLKEEVLYRGKTQEEFTTMTGRSALWKSYWDAFCERPTLGYGYAVGSRTQGIVYQTNTHSSFFAVIMGSGLVGLSICAWALLLGTKEGVAAARNHLPGGVGCFCALGTGLLNSMSISLLAESWCPPAFVFITVYAFHLCLVPDRAVFRPGNSRKQSLRLTSSRPHFVSGNALASKTACGSASGQNHAHPHRT
jgi:O-antigen ligase